MAQGFTFIKLANKEGERIPWRDPNTGQTHLINPRSQKIEGWPGDGVFMQEVLKEASISTKQVSKMILEGTLKVEGEKIKSVPSGPPEDPNASFHTFRHFTFMTFLMKDGEKRYKVTRNPDKVRDGKVYRVDWMYDLKLVKG